jgi:hypothetical protein
MDCLLAPFLSSRLSSHKAQIWDVLWPSKTKPPAPGPEAGSQHVRGTAVREKCKLSWSILPARYILAKAGDPA